MSFYLKENTYKHSRGNGHGKKLIYESIGFFPWLFILNHIILNLGRGSGNLVRSCFLLKLAVFGLC